MKFRIVRAIPIPNSEFALYKTLKNLLRNDYVSALGWKDTIFIFENVLWLAETSRHAVHGHLHWLGVRTRGNCGAGASLELHPGITALRHIPRLPPLKVWNVESNDTFRSC